ncbi:MAG TPA: peptidoglycan-associated lipoprotein Pal [Candidatus Eisenbacteria bacterium]
MRRKPRIATLVLAGATLALTVALGCASRKQVTTATPEPTPPPPTETPAPPQETAPPPPPAEQPTMALEDAFFDFDDASLRQDAKSALEGDAKYLEKNSSANVVIEGHCDERGSVEYNLALGEKRARAAKDYLVSYGIPANRMTTISYGKERPFDPGHSEDAWSKNRRAHFVPK